MCKWLDKTPTQAGGHHHDYDDSDYGDYGDDGDSDDGDDDDGDEHSRDVVQMTWQDAHTQRWSPPVAIVERADHRKPFIGRQEVKVKDHHPPPTG